MATAAPPPPLLLRGVPVTFPHAPYPQQVVFMERVIEALQGGHDALLESPTGTGKTICLLAAALSWLQQYVHAHVAAGDGTPFPKLIYASRTHSQLGKVVAELKGTTYRPRMTVLGSRAQLCVHPQVERAPLAAKNGMCRTLVSGGRCEHHDGVQRELTAAPHRAQVLDIEDMLTLGRERVVCPYYLAREQSATAEIAFMPYNYLIDSSIRKVLGDHSLEGAVLIFDEAHNLDSVCADAASFDLAESELAECLGTTQRMLDSGNLDEDTAVAAREVLARVPVLLTNLKSLTLGEHTGMELIEAFNAAGMTPVYAETSAEALESLSSALSAANLSPAGLTALCNALRLVHEPARMLNVTPAMVASHYRTHIADTGRGRMFSYWCFHPGIALRVLRARHNVRCVLLASGTLSPMDSFASELGSSFPVRLENPHVIKSQQLWAGIFKIGPSSVPLDHSFGNRNSPAYLRDLGSALVNFARVTPEGVLVFFPSYTSLEMCVTKWREDGSWQSLLKYKRIVLEPRSQSECTQAMAEYQALIRNRSAASGGAMFMAVCRGKVSEGLDFADANGRAVIVVGIPNPNVADPKVTLKKRFLDSERRTNPTLLSGDDWYAQQASCAVNQAVGRVIRHRLDYGAMIFLDCRFAQLAQSSNKSFVSAWIRPYVKIFDDFGSGLTSLKRFFQKTPEFVAKLREEEELAREAERTAADALRLVQNRKRNALAVRPDGNEGDALSDHNARQHHESGLAPDRAKKQLAAQAYLELAKTALDAQAYRKFQQVLRSYKAHSITTSSVLEECYPLFDNVGDATARDRLISDFAAFLPVSARQEYRDFLARQRVRPSSLAVEAQTTPATPLPVQRTPSAVTPSAGLRDVSHIIESRGRARIERRGSKVARVDVEADDSAAAAAAAVVVSSQTPPPPPAQPDTVPSGSVAEPGTPSAGGGGPGPKCPICQDKVKMPFSARCGHVCCHECWNAWLDQKLECPICKDKVRRKQLQKLYFA